MTGTKMVALLVGIPLFALTLWIASNTYWAETTVPMPPRGEALRNPFYAVQRFAEALGARTAWDRALTIPSADAAIVLSAFHWGLSRQRRDALERWVESGGRLVVDSDLIGGGDDFERWSGIVRGSHEADTAPQFLEPASHDDRCHSLQGVHGATPSSVPDATGHRMCGVDPGSFLTTRRAAAWALSDASGIQAVRVAVGRGSVTIVNATPFLHRSLFDGDHGWLFVAATQLRPGDEVRFFSEGRHASLLSLLWQHGRGGVLLSLACVALGLWRGSIRFGPLAAPTDTARRSLAEQIRGTGEFLVRYGGGESLHAAVVRALDEVARRRIPSYAHLSAKDRAAAVAGLAGVDRHGIAVAINNPRSRRSHELRGTIAALEATRRTLIERTGSHHGRR